mgnify:CR=1 FL=1
MKNKLRIVICGVENSGKTTLAHELSHRLEMNLVEEQCRFSDAIIKGDYSSSTLEQIHVHQEELVVEGFENSRNGVICDTSSFELRMWSVEEFGIDLDLEIRVPVDIYIFCNTLSNWEEDPLRTLPDFEARKNHEGKLLEFIKGVVVLPEMGLESRVNKAIEIIDELRS